MTVYYRRKKVSGFFKAPVHTVDSKELTAENSKFIVEHKVSYSVIL